MFDGMRLVNYCHKSCTPLMNIMRLPEAEAFALAAKMAKENPQTTAFYRFADFPNYYPRRMEADARLHAAFAELGGHPVEQHPLSFVLQGSDYLAAWFDHGIVTEIPLACVPEEQVSFTLGDSMAVLARDGRFTMLTLGMLAQAMEDHPEGPAGWLREAQEKHHYIEVQLWDDSVCFFAKLTRQLSLGSLVAPPIRLSGGYTHRMFRLDTTTGRYAVKLLTPEIMQRPEALENYRTAEAFEALLEARGLPILPALTIDGRKMQQVDGQYLYVFEYFEGCALADGEITPAHCRAMGRVLAGIHGAGTSVGEGLSLPATVETPQSATSADSSPRGKTLWRELADALLSSDDARAEGEILLSAAPMLTRVTAAAEDAARRLPPMEALCHNDMDPKNVLWQGADFRIIDLECLGYANPRLELLDLAISWAGAAVEEGWFKAFMQGYGEAGGSFGADAALVYDSRRNYIDWLAYNARRALAADPEERRIGREQVRMTVAKIEDDLQSREKVLRWMDEVWRR